MSWADFAPPFSTPSRMPGFLLRSHQDEIAGSAAVLDASEITAEKGEGFTFEDEAHPNGKHCLNKQLCSVIINLVND